MVRADPGLAGADHEVDPTSVAAARDIYASTNTEILLVVETWFDGFVTPR